MKKTIKIDNKNKFKIDTSNNWLRIYRDQFGHDILPDIVPMLDAGIEIVANVYNGGDDDIVEMLEDKVLQLETVTWLNIIWALAKNADENIGDPEEWDREFDKSPLDEIVPQVVDALASTYVSTKKLRLLKEGWGTRLSQLMQFSSQESTED